jgi:hypothetical protein
LFTQLGYGSCHTGRPAPGPPLDGLFGQPTLEDGQTVTADENYIRESITARKRKSSPATSHYADLRRADYRRTAAQIVAI